MIIFATNYSFSSIIYCIIIIILFLLLIIQVITHTKSSLSMIQQQTQHELLHTRFIMFYYGTLLLLINVIKAADAQNLPNRWHQI